jgi:TolB-like protein
MMRFIKILSFALTIIMFIISCGPKPAVYFRKQISFKPYKTLAILPFNNYSGTEDAGKQVTDAFLVEFLKKPFFNVVEPGQVDGVMRDERIRSSDQINYATAKFFKDKLAADYVLIGAVNEYTYQKKGESETPLVGFSARILDTSNGQIIWAATHSRSGDDAELIFNWGMVTSLTKLTQLCVHDVTSSIKIEH